MENTEIAPEEIAAYFGSKLDMYRVFTIDRKRIPICIIHSWVLLARLFSLHNRFSEGFVEEKEESNPLLVE